MKRKSPEADFQKALVAYLRASLPYPWFVFRIPNGIQYGGKKGSREQRIAMLKTASSIAMGEAPGMPDLAIIGPLRMTNILPHVFFVECKSPRGRLSSNQIEVAGALIECGCCVTSSTTIEQVEEWLRSYGVPLKGRIAA